MEFHKVINTDFQHKVRVNFCPATASKDAHLYLGFTSEIHDGEPLGAREFPGDTKILIENIYRNLKARGFEVVTDSAFVGDKKHPTAVYLYHRTYKKQARLEAAAAGVLQDVGFSVTPDSHEAAAAENKGKAGQNDLF